MNLLGINLGGAFFNRNVTVMVLVGDPQKCKVHKLNLNDNLSKIRKQLEKTNTINNTLSFSMRIPQSNDYAEIAREHEERFLLDNIIDIDDYYSLRLIDTLNPYWSFFNDKYKLDYGCMMTNDGIRRSKNRAFEMKDCEMTRFNDEECSSDKVEFNLNEMEDWIMKTNLFFNTTDIKIQNFVKFGISVGTLNMDDFKSKNNLSYNYIEYRKLSLKFRDQLEPTDEFIREIEHAIKAENPESFIQITERFGQYIPTEVIFGGRIYFEDFKDDNNLTRSKDYKKLIGGRYQNLENFNEMDEEAWIKTLEEFRCWDCIEYQNPINIFRLLPEELCKKVFLLVGKKILYSNIEDFNYQLEECGRPTILKLKNMPLDISKIIRNEEADCDIFATLIDTGESRGDLFNCQILWPPNKGPSLIIHCIQKEFKKRECKLRISWMVVGYDIGCNFTDFNTQLKVLRKDFNASDGQTMLKLFHFEHNSLIRKMPICIGIPVLNNLDYPNDSLVIGHTFFSIQEKASIGACTFSYCLKNHYYVNLPDFSFHTLMISNYPISNDYGTLPFEHSDAIPVKSDNLKPRYISLYSMGVNYCGPIFLKQKSEQIKIKYLSCEKSYCYICKSKIKVLEKSIQCAFFNPPISKPVIDNNRSSYIKPLQSPKSLFKPPPSPAPNSNTAGIAVIQQLKLNYGLFLDGFDIQARQAVFMEDGELSISQYDGQPIVYIANDSAFPAGFHNSNNINLDVALHLKKSDACINFPIAEITYNANQLDSFPKHVDDERKLYDTYGHFLARKFLAGDQLFIKNFNSATETQINILKFYLFCAYNSAKYSIEIPFNNLFPLNLLPKLETLDGEVLDTHEKAVKWLNNLKKKIFIIFYDDLIPISQLSKHNTLSTVDNKEQFKVTNFKEKLSFEEWVGDTHNNLMSWARDFHVFRGLVINENYEMDISKKIAINFIKIPRVESRVGYSFNTIKPSTKLEVILISNNIFSIKNLISFPFIKNDVKGYEDYAHVRINHEQYEILLDNDNVNPTEEFEQTIEKALNSMKPLKALQDLFNEYGHLFPQRIVLGRSLRNILPSNTINTINVKSSSSTFESLETYSNKLNISHFLTQKGIVIERNGLANWTKNTDNDLEIIEFDRIIPLYKILRDDQQRKIDDLLKGDFKVIMTGITDLKDLDNSNVKHYKRVNVEPSLESENYEGFGSIISNDNSKLEEFYVNFGLYDLNGFFAVIKKIKESSIINIKECYVLWMIIGNSSKLPVFSPNNRKIQANLIEESITLMPDIQMYNIKTPPLSLGCTILINAYCPSTNCELNNIKLIDCSNNSINVQIISEDLPEIVVAPTAGPKTRFLLKRKGAPLDTATIESATIDVKLHVCIIPSNYKSFKVDNARIECPLNLIGNNVTEGYWRTSSDNT